MYEYKVSLVKVVDGDTVDVDIDLGFGMTIKNKELEWLELIRQKAEQEI